MENFPYLKNHKVDEKRMPRKKENLNFINIYLQGCTERDSGAKWQLCSSNRQPIGMNTTAGQVACCANQVCKDLFLVLRQLCVCVRYYIITIILDLFFLNV